MEHEALTPEIQLVAAVAFGALSWSLVEYAIHGLLAHRLRTPVSPLHWGHHETPAAVFTSPLAWLPIAVAIFAVGSFATDMQHATAFVTGLLAGFLHYEFVHWRIHFRPPLTRRQERLRSHHLAHHFVNPAAYHGVTTRFWDRVFGSLPRSWERDYARAASRQPIVGPSNLRASWSPRLGWQVVRQAIRRSNAAR